MSSSKQLLGLQATQPAPIPPAPLFPSSPLPSATTQGTGHSVNAVSIGVCSLVVVVVGGGYVDGFASKWPRFWLGMGVVVGVLRCVPKKT